MRKAAVVILRFAPLITALLVAGSALVMAQEPFRGRIYIGTLRDAPSWVWQVPKISTDAKQMAANAAWIKWVESVCAQQRAEARKAMEDAEAARANCVADVRNRTPKPEAGGLQYARVRGIILAYDPHTLCGVISGQDGKRWPFRAAEWADCEDGPKRGLWVDFVPDAESGYALVIYSLGPFTTQHLEVERLR